LISEFLAIIEASEDEKWSSSEPSSDISISSIDLEETLKTEKRDVGVGTSEQPYGCAVCGDKLKRKIEEYEEKIQEVVEDKNRIVEIRKHLEQKERDFAKKKREFEDEKANLVYELESERKKMIKEKQVFQTYVKDSQNRPNKRERQEISNLKQEVADLSETLKLKESKNGMTQARLRNQIKQLEKDNSNLKDEVERLTKENAKLSATQKLNRRPSDAKILHEINKNISKLTQETLRTKKCDQAEADKSERNKSFDKDNSLLETGTSHVDLETQYENTFRNQSPRETSTSTGKTEHTLEDGTKQIRYPNGNVKIVSPDGNQISVTFFNGDKQETNLIDGTVRYYFSERKICQTTYADGLELVEFPE
jgi:DNA repair exonuclease SbcCD ATPase subunit